MESRVVYLPKSRELKNPKLSIIQFLIKKGVYVDSIKCTGQELIFSSEKEAENIDEHWSKELNNFFKGKIDFKAKRPS